MSVRSFSFSAILFFLICLTACAGTSTATPSEAAGVEAEIILAADATELRPGECTRLHWEVIGGFDVTLDNEAVPKVGDKEICPQETRTYTLAVDLGTSIERRTLEVIVQGEAVPGEPVAGPTEPTAAPTEAVVTPAEPAAAPTELQLWPNEAAPNPGHPAYEVEEWIKMGGPPGGLGYDIRMDPTNPDVMFVTDSFAGIMKSTDGGQSWTPQNTGIEPSPDPTWPIFSTTIDPHDHNTIWVGTQYTGQIYRSTDGGLTWELRNTGLMTTDGVRSVRGITIDPNDANIVYAGVEVGVTRWYDGAPEFSPGRLGPPTGGEVYKSLDAGSTWTRIWQGDSLARYIWIDPRDTGRIYVSTGIFDRKAVNSNLPDEIWGGVGILRSDDGGATWTVLDQDNGLGGLYIPSLFMHPENPDILVAAVTTPCDPGCGGVYVTYDGGDTWQQILQRPGSLSMDAVEISTANPQVWYAATENAIFRSDDSGRNWQEFFMGSSERDSGMPIDLQVDPRDPYRIFVNNYGGGNFVSEDGGETWVDASRGYSGGLVSDIEVVPGNGATLIVGADTSTYRSDDGGKTWQGTAISCSNALSLIPGQEAGSYSLLATDCEWGNILFSNDGGQTLTEVNVVNIGANVHIMRALTVAPSDSQVIFTGFTYGSCPGMSATFILADCDYQMPGFFRSQDGGATWTALTGAPFNQAQVQAIAIHPTNAQIVYAATVIGLFRSRDQGESWQELQALETSAMNTLGPGQNDFTQRGGIVASEVAIDPNEPSTIYAGVMPGVIFRSKDEGDTWEQIISGLQPQDVVFDILPDPDRPGLFYLATTSSGVLYTTDGGDTWLPTGGGRGFANIRILALSEDGSVLYAGTRRSGVWRLGTPVIP